MSERTAVGRMVRVTRETKGWTQHELAVTAKVSQGFLSKVEKGVLPLTDDYLSDVAAALEVPTTLLLATHPMRGLEVTCLHHRRRASAMAVATVRRVEGLVHLTHLSVLGLTMGATLPTPRTVYRLPVDLGRPPEQIARALRSAWRIPAGPLENVTELLESLGVVVVRRDLGTTAQDAVSTWPRDSSPVVLVNKGLSTDRERFTLCHELGHLVMHELPHEEQERHANRFAGELLAPADEIRPHLEGLTVRQFGKLAELKIAWGVSMAALIQRALDLECISPSQFKSFRIRLNQYGWSTHEPGDLPPESPHILNRLIDTQLRLHDYDHERVAALALMLPAPFYRHYLAARPHLMAISQTGKAQS